MPEKRLERTRQAYEDTLRDVLRKALAAQKLIEANRPKITVKPMN